MYNMLSICMSFLIPFLCLLWRPMRPIRILISSGVGGEDSFFSLNLGFRCGKNQKPKEKEIKAFKILKGKTSKQGYAVVQRSHVGSWGPTG